MKKYGLSIILFLLCGLLSAQTAMTNIYGRKVTSLNGSWKVIVDPFDAGTWRQVWLERQPQLKTEFAEYSFDEGPEFHVPGDFNTQMPEIFFMEGTVWYKKLFHYKPGTGERQFLHFGAVNYRADVYCNGKYIGMHEGGFTPFQFEITKFLQQGNNSIVVKVNNLRRQDGIPGSGYDWFNYGGITRDVNLVYTGKTYIEDYFIQLKKNSLNEVAGWIKLSEPVAGKTIIVSIPELKINNASITDATGIAALNFKTKLQLWSPENPRLYKVLITSETDTVEEEIGFRSLEVKETGVLLNGKPVFFKGVNIHEERPYAPARACTEADAMILLSWTKELGCNLVRLAHYPHSEFIVKQAEKMGIMVWDEIPVYQHVAFSSPGFTDKMELMMKEMIRRDQNRCNVVIWSLSNETYTDTPDRTKVLVEMTKKCRNIDSTRLITSVLSNWEYKDNTFNVWDTLCRSLDIIAVNEYLGWYQTWQGDPAETKWIFNVQKPVIISEFGGEAKYGNHSGPADEANSWNEDYQENIYRNQVILFDNVPNLTGLCPWILVDYRSPVRMQPVYQQGFNRKGLLSEYGEKKKAWYIMHDYYNSR